MRRKVTVYKRKEYLLKIFGEILFGLTFRSQICDADESIYHHQSQPAAINMLVCRSELCPTLKTHVQTKSNETKRKTNELMFKRKEKKVEKVGRRRS